jgi:hypothetical protein
MEIASMRMGELLLVAGTDSGPAPNEQYRRSARILTDYETR